MSEIENITVSDEADTLEYEVIEILVTVGDHVNSNDVIAVVEGDKATLDITSAKGGVVISVEKKVGDKVAGSDVILTLEYSSSSQNQKENNIHFPEQNKKSLDIEVVVIGAGPGGYTAAFRCADLGASVILIDKNIELGGTCLNVGCIPSKALLHAANVIQETESSAQFGVSFKSVVIDINKLRKWKDSIVKQLTGGIKHLAKKRAIKILTGIANFTSSNSLRVVSDNANIDVNFKHAIIATGSYTSEHPLFSYQEKYVLSSDNALDINDIPNRLLIIGCGVIGLEMASVYQSLGSKVTMLDTADTILYGSDNDLINEFKKESLQKYESIHLNANILDVNHENDEVIINIQKDEQCITERFDKVLIAIGRRPASESLAIEDLGMNTDGRGFIQVKKNYQTNISNIFAIGDVTGGPMLAHKALYEGKKAAESIMKFVDKSQLPSIPAVVYTDPEIAWVGVSEQQAQERELDFSVSKINWSVNGRLLCHGKKSGLTKLIIDNNTNCVLGAGIIGPNAGELITEFSIAIDLKVNVEELSNIIHPHPTFSETSLLALESYLGVATDVYSPN